MVSDQSWINFYLSKSKLSDRSSKVVHLELEMKEAANTNMKFRAYKVLKIASKVRSYLDRRPFGYDMKELARIDLLGILPCLTIVPIAVDDYNHKGEQNVKVDQGALSVPALRSRRRCRGREATMVICSGSTFLTSALTQKPGLSRSPCKVLLGTSRSWP